MAQKSAELLDLASGHGCGPVQAQRCLILPVATGVARCKKICYRVAWLQRAQRCLILPVATGVARCKKKCCNGWMAPKSPALLDLASGHGCGPVQEEMLYCLDGSKEPSVA